MAKHVQDQDAAVEFMRRPMNGLQWDHLPPAFQNLETARAAISSVEAQYIPILVGHLFPRWIREELVRHYPEWMRDRLGRPFGTREFTIPLQIPEFKNALREMVNMRFPLRLLHRANEPGKPFCILHRLNNDCYTLLLHFLTPLQLDIEPALMQRIKHTYLENQALEAQAAQDAAAKAKRKRR